MRTYLVLALGLFWTMPVNAQEWVAKYRDPAVPLGEAVQAHDAFLGTKAYERGKGHKVFERERWFWEQRTYPSGLRPMPGHYQREWRQLKARAPLAAPKSAAWQQLGPVSWGTTSYNPGNGRVNCIAIAPQDHDVIYVGTPAGGLWRSLDAGVTWSSFGQDLPSIGVSGIALHPTDPQVIYIATGDGDSRDTYSIGVMKSTDGGNSWASTGLLWDTHQVRTTRKLIMHPTDPQVLFCAANNGLWRTVDEAATWQRVATGSFYDVEFKPGDPTVVYASTDQFWRSMDGGASFTQITSGVPAENLLVRIAIAVTPADPQMVYLLAGREDDGGFRGLFRSTKSGASFVQRSATPNILGYSDSGSDSGGQAWYDLALAADPTDANTIYAAGINVWKSTDGGTGWDISSMWTWDSGLGYTHADVHALEIVDGEVYCGSDGGLFRTSDGGLWWDDLSAGLNITQFYRLGVSTHAVDQVVAGAQDNGCIHLEGGGWTHVQGGDGMECISDPVDDQIFYCASQYGTIYRSDDGGYSFWGTSGGITEEGAWVTPYVMDPSDHNTLYAGYVNLWRTDDGGANWMMLTNLGGQRKVSAIAVAPSDPQVILFCNNQALRRSTDGGNSFQVIGTGLPTLAITYIAIDPLDPDLMCVTLSGFLEGEKVYHTTDGGNTWNNISGNLPNVPANTIVLSGSNGGMYIGTDLGVFYRDDDLGNWQPYWQNMPNTIVMELEIDPTEQQLYAATYGRGIWRTPLFTPSNQAPVADFTATPLTLCPGDPVHFEDMALEAAPGWTWQFPGGTPSSSTDAEPDVVYPASGTYTASLTVSNAFGNDTHSADITVAYTGERIDVDLVLDQYGKESSWSITDDLGNVVAYGGTYDGLLSGTVINASTCLADGCYTFTMHDSYGDGMCCDNGNGSYSVSGSVLGQIAAGGTFAMEESTPFCVDNNVVVPAQTSANSVVVRTLDQNGLFALRTPNANDAWTVYDAMGRRLFTSQAQGQEALIDLRAYATGSYIVLSAQHGAVRLMRP
ncbi:MAG: PKD domain-containing protein [Flavobacteriales bacterium]|nr:PKD domain-containing protein [Flavobacteriales bacterium]